MVDHPKKNILIVDSTLRDGEQAPDVVFTESERLYLAERLCEIGVDEIEAGIPAGGPDEIAGIRAIAKLNLSCDLSVWCRALDRDIELAAQCDVPMIHISFPVSPIQLDVMGKDYRWVFESLEKRIAFAKKFFDRVAIGALDATRCDDHMLFEFISEAASLYVDRVRLADTTGIATPVRIYHLLKEIKKRHPEIHVGFHGHNDLGMATANTISAIEGGADSVDVTVNGIGERCGNAALEEVAVAIGVSGAYLCSIDINKISELCEYVSNVTKKPIPPNKPVTGSAIFNHSSGIHCRGIEKNPLAFQPFLPESVGKSGARFLAGKHSGTSGIRKILNDIGVDATPDQIKDILKRVKARAISKGGSLSSLEVKSLYDACFS